jgi:hypothetical protein
VDDLQIGDQVYWIQARKWNLKDSVGTVLELMKGRPDAVPTYQVKFPFGRLTLERHQLQCVAKAH